MFPSKSGRQTLKKMKQAVWNSANQILELIGYQAQTSLLQDFLRHDGHIML